MSNPDLRPLPPFSLDICRGYEPTQPVVIGDVNDLTDPTPSAADIDWKVYPLLFCTSTLSSINEEGIVEGLEQAFPTEAKRFGVALKKALTFIKGSRHLSALINEELELHAVYQAGRYGELQDEGLWHDDATLFTGYVVLEGDTMDVVAQEPINREDYMNKLAAMYKKDIYADDMREEIATRPINVGEVALFSGATMHRRPKPRPGKRRSLFVLSAFRFGA